jgi:hypothetical protein
MVEPHNFQTLTPCFIDPTTMLEAKSFLNLQGEKLKVKPPLIDPYTSLPFYSVLLAINNLKLPDWSLEAATRNMYKLLV